MVSVCVCLCVCVWLCSWVCVWSQYACVCVCVCDCVRGFAYGVWSLRVGPKRIIKRHDMAKDIGMPTHTHTHTHTQDMELRRQKCVCVWAMGWLPWVGSLKITGLFCKRALWKRRYSARETCNLEESITFSHPIWGIAKDPHRAYRYLVFVGLHPIWGRTNRLSKDKV